MNCKQGDLAVVIEGAAVGYIVTCVARYDGPWFDMDYEPGWKVDRPIPKMGGRPEAFIYDKGLRPIRPQPDDAVDEVIQRVGTPHKEVA